MKIAWLSAILNFFTMGLGYIYNGKRWLMGILLTLGAGGLTYLENFHQYSEGNNLQKHDQNAFFIMFACVLIINLGLAIDAYLEAKSINHLNS